MKHHEHVVNKLGLKLWHITMIWYVEKRCQQHQHEWLYIRKLVVNSFHDTLSSTPACRDREWKSYWWRLPLSCWTFLQRRIAMRPGCWWNPKTIKNSTNTDGVFKGIYHQVMAIKHMKKKLHISVYIYYYILYRDNHSMAILLWKWGSNPGGRVKDDWKWLRFLICRKWWYNLGFGNFNSWEFTIAPTNTNPAKIESKKITFL